MLNLIVIVAVSVDTADNVVDIDRTEGPGCLSSLRQSMRTSRKSSLTWQLLDGACYPASEQEERSPCDVYEACLAIDWSHINCMPCHLGIGIKWAYWLSVTKSFSFPLNATDCGITMDGIDPTTVLGRFQPKATNFKAIRQLKNQSGSHELHL